MQYFSDVVQDRNGNVVTNASVLIKNYPALTTATIYDSTGASIANPITTSSDGEYTFYANPGAYTFVISKSGITSITISNKSLGGTLNNFQSAEYTPVSIFEHTLATSGAAPFQMHQQSYDNTAGGAGTFNHGVFLGFNAARHSGLTATANKPALIMGMEDNYYDPAGDLARGMEWYVEYWSPDGTSVQMLRPFYSRMLSDNNSRNRCNTVMNIGTDGSGQWAVLSGTTNLLTVDGTKTAVAGNLSVAGQISNNNANPSMSVGGTNTSTGDAYIAVGGSRTGSGNSYINLIGDTTYTSFGLRILRANLGANSYSVITQRGTGGLYLATNEAASILFQTTQVTRFEISPTGNVLINGMTVGTSGDKVLAIANGTAPSSSPAGGGQLYVEAGALKYRGSSGTVTTVGVA